MEPCYTVDEAVKLLNISVKTFRKHVNEGRIIKLRHGLYEKQSIDNLPKILEILEGYTRTEALNILNVNPKVLNRLIKSGKLIRLKKNQYSKDSVKQNSEEIRERKRLKYERT